MRNDYDAHRALLENASRRCPVPPAGWYCTRERGHDGPCAAWPYTREEYEPPCEQWNTTTVALLVMAALVFGAAVVGAFL